MQSPLRQLARAGTGLGGCRRLQHECQSAAFRRKAIDPTRRASPRAATGSASSFDDDRPSRRQVPDQYDFDDPGRGAVARRRAAEAAARRRQGSGGSAAAAPAAPRAASSSSTRLQLLVRYDGTNFAGFQFQTAGVRTVQGELEKALARVLPLRGRVVGAGRTDGGAHAMAMSAHVDVGGLDSEPADAAAAPLDLGLATLHLNGHLPADVKVLSMARAPEGMPRAAAKGLGRETDEEEDDDGNSNEAQQQQQQPFDAQACALGKEYHYLLSVSPHPDPFQEGPRRWWAYERFSEATRGRPQSVSAFRAFDLPAARAALAALVGAPRDFTALSDVKRPSGLGAAKRKRPKLAKLAEQGLLGPRPARSALKNTRTLWRAELLGDGDGDDGRFKLVLAGDGFLYHQVRVTAAAVLEIGQGRLSVEAFLEGLEARDRAFGGGAGGGRSSGGGGGGGASSFECAPASGLYLARVFYPGDDDLPRP